MVITGGATGIGLATAKRFAAEGARVFLTGRREAELQAAKEAIGPNATAVAADSAKNADLDRLFRQVKEEAGKIDVVFANAGGGEMLPIGAVTEAHFDDIFSRNVRGVLFTAQKALPLLVDGGSIILTGSTAGSMGMPAFSVYCASKAAVRSFARTRTQDLKDRRIRVNVVSRGATKTPGLFGLAPPDFAAQEALAAALLADIPMGRLGEADEIAGAVLLLASNEASFITGIELFVDGGTAQV